MKRPFLTRRANYPDIETARLLGDYHWRPSGPKRGHKSDNRLWIKCDAEAHLLLAHVATSPALYAVLCAGLAALAARKFRSPTLASPPRVRREQCAREQRRRYFIGLFNLALPEYLATHPFAPPAFTETPRYLSVAFRRLCVREHYREVYGNPDLRDA